MGEFRLYLRHPKRPVVKAWLNNRRPAAKNNCSRPSIYDLFQGYPERLTADLALQAKPLCRPQQLLNFFFWHGGNTCQGILTAQARVFSLT